MGLFRKTKKAEVVDLRDDTVIDLTESGSAMPKPQWGFPTRCPECGDFGYLDRIDVVHEIMFQHCPTCWSRWETHRSATADA